MTDNTLNGSIAKYRMRNNSETEGRVIRVDRRTILKAGAGLGIAAATGTTGAFLATREDSRPVATPETPLPPFDINSEITESDWNEIDTVVASSRERFDSYERYREEDNQYVWTPVDWKALIAPVNKEKAERIQLYDFDLQNRIDSMQEMIDNGINPYVVGPYSMGLVLTAASTIVASPESASEVRAVINKCYERIHGSFNWTVSRSAWALPFAGFGLRNVLYPGDKDINPPDWQWNSFKEEMNGYYNQYQEGRKMNSSLGQDKIGVISNALAPLKHFAPEQLSDYYYDTDFRLAMRRDSIDYLAYYRSSSDQNKSDRCCDGQAVYEQREGQTWGGFIKKAYDSRLLEANSVQMTPSGLVLS